MPIVAAVGWEKKECEVISNVATWQWGEFAQGVARPERLTGAEVGQLSEKDSPWFLESSPGAVECRRKGGRVPVLMDLNVSCL